MIWVTGDTHGNIDSWKLNTEDFKNKVKPEDYILICGDFGHIWNGSVKEQMTLDTFDKRVGTYLFIDGNHENHPLINNYPVEEWNGGLVHRIRPSIIHLMRGQVFNIEGKTIFTMGGATSIDKDWRIPGESWWPEEMPSDEELLTGEQNLDKVKWDVDYVVTHAAPNNTHDDVLGKFQTKKHDKLTTYLQTIDDKLTYKKWYFGHYHEDLEVDEKHRALYQNVISMEEDNGNSEI